MRAMQLLLVRTKNKTGETNAETDVHSKRRSRNPYRTGLVLRRSIGPAAKASEAGARCMDSTRGRRSCRARSSTCGSHRPPCDHSGNHLSDGYDRWPPAAPLGPPGSKPCVPGHNLPGIYARYRSPYHGRGHPSSGWISRQLRETVSVGTVKKSIAAIASRCLFRNAAHLIAGSGFLGA